MQEKFLSYIAQEHLFNTKEKILLTVSGGVDSIVMCDLFHAAGFAFAIAHCNFQLREQESEGDELFVKEIAEKYAVPFYHTRFDTAAYSKKHKLSIQAAARELRYDWFEKIRIQHHFHYIATAHHEGDVIETFFINLIRGTGISGLRSIVPKQGKIIRPLLFANKKDILIYAAEQKISYREDSSNASDKYLRNKIRHQLMPVLNEFSPVAESSIMQSIEKLRAAEFIYKQTIEEVSSRICIKKNNTIRISIAEIKKLNPVSTYLYELLKPYGFNSSTTSSILKSLNGEPGKLFFGSTHRLIKDRTALILEPFQISEMEEEYVIQKNEIDFMIPGLQFNFSIVSNTAQRAVSKLPDHASVDLDKIKFPLTLRRWKTGDTFYPLGMKGKKKLSDFFTDKKLSLMEKEKIWLLCSEEKIVWVIGMRLDERFKVKERTKTIFHIETIPGSREPDTL